MYSIASRLIVVAALLLCASRAAAADPPADPTSDTPPPAAPDPALAEAKAHFDEGKNAYLAGDYAKAIREFQAAEAIRPSPILDYNIALGYDGLGDLSSALAWYQHYIETKPDAHNRDDVEQRIAAIKSALGPQRQPPPTENAPVPHAQQQMAPPAQQPPPVGQPLPQYPQPPQTRYGQYDPYGAAYYPPGRPQPAPPRRGRWWIAPVVMGAAAIVAIVVAASVRYGVGDQVVYGVPPAGGALVRF